MATSTHRRTPSAVVAAAAAATLSLVLSSVSPCGSGCGPSSSSSSMLVSALVPPAASRPRRAPTTTATGTGTGTSLAARSPLFSSAAAAASSSASIEDGGSDASAVAAAGDGVTGSFDFGSLGGDVVIVNGEVETAAETASSAAAAAIPEPTTVRRDDELNGVQSKLVRLGLTLYIASMCLALPLTLLPLRALHRLNVIDRLRRERWSLRAAQFCSRWLFRLIPFAKLKVLPSGDPTDMTDPKPSVWVCNHASMLDVFVLLASDKKLRGPKRRPIKIVYWKGLETNPVTRLLFTMCGFISVEMADNGNGNPNEYDRSSFRKLLTDAKTAFEEGYDVGLLPEGQLNPHPELGLLEIFSGAYTLARMSKRPVRMMAMSGAHRVWPPEEAGRGTEPTGRTVKVRAYPPSAHNFENGEEFAETFGTVVGRFGATGEDLPETELEGWLNGERWREVKEAREIARKAVEAMKGRYGKEE